MTFEIFLTTTKLSLNSIRPFTLGRFTRLRVLNGFFTLKEKDLMI